MRCCYVSCEGDCAEEDGFGLEEGGASGEVGALRKTVCFRIWSRRGIAGKAIQGGDGGDEVSVDVTDRPSCLRAKGRFGCQVEGGCGNVLLRSAPGDAVI